MHKFLVGAVVFLAFGCSTPPADVPPVSAAQRAAQDAATKAPTCALDMTAPFAATGSNFFGAGSLQDCSYGAWDGVLEVRASVHGYIVGLDVDVARARPGNTYDLGLGPDGFATAVAFGADYAPCEGTLTWTSGAPDWAVSVSAVCHGAQGDYRLDAAFHGHVYDGND